MNKLILLSAVFGAVAAQDPESGGDARAVAAAGAFFVENCVACHVVPDLSYAVDRAWLNQVADTA